MEAVNDALKYVVQARKLLKDLCLCYECLQGKHLPQQDALDLMAELLDNAEESLVKPK